MSLYDYLQPPRGWIGGVLPEEVDVGTGREVAMVVSHLTAYPAGLAFRVTVLSRSDPAMVCRDNLEASGRTGTDSADLHLCIGVEFSDGRCAIQKTRWIGASAEGGLGEFPSYPKQMPPDPALDLILNVSGSEASEREFVADCWVWPMPPAGAVGFKCGWPAAGIPIGCKSINAEILHAAAKRAEPLWDLEAA
jgi:hypothetical protein